MRAMLVRAGQLDVGIATLFRRLFSRIAQTGGFDRVRRQGVAIGVCCCGLSGRIRSWRGERPTVPLHSNSLQECYVHLNQAGFPGQRGRRECRTYGSTGGDRIEGTIAPMWKIGAEK